MMELTGIKNHFTLKVLEMLRRTTYKDRQHVATNVELDANYTAEMRAIRAAEERAGF